MRFCAGGATGEFAPRYAHERVDVDLTAERVGALVAEDGEAVPAVRDEVVHDDAVARRRARSAPPSNVTEPATIVRRVDGVVHW